MITLLIRSKTENVDLKALAMVIDGIIVYAVLMLIGTWLIG